MLQTFEVIRMATSFQKFGVTYNEFSVGERL